jgi:hypothetical protein
LRSCPSLHHRSSLKVNYFANRLSKSSDLIETVNLEAEFYSWLRRNAAFRIKAVVAVTRAIQTRAATIEPKINATMRAAMAIATNKIPPVTSFKRETGPRLGE